MAGSDDDAYTLLAEKLPLLFPLSPLASRIKKLPLLIGSLQVREICAET